MDTLMVIIVIFNLFISLFSVSETLYKKKKYIKEIASYNEKFADTLELLEDKANSEQFENVLKNYCYDLKTKIYSDDLYHINKNRFMILIILNESCNFFSNIYKDKKIYCNIRINKDNQFYTIAHFRCKDTLSINERLYYPEQNTDLINISTNNFNRFVISNIDDFKGSNVFTLQNRELNNRSKALISISIKKKTNLMGCYTIYFSKPLDDRIKLKDLEFAITTLKNKITNLIEEYIELNKDNKDITDNALIENKIS